ncbi:hypothetical protein OG229_14820 [Streptomyces platensis]|uniref:hypothetical protein n=1 Tax=Streptomyces platensis TaxID=58346 RepID=UPI002E15F785|nr:hypothetical protein OG229_14820 [Streptomyces platensis]
MNERRHYSRRLALKDHITMADVNQYAESHGWVSIGVIKKNPDEGVFYEKKWQVREGISFHYIVDDFMGERYVMAVSQDSDADDELTGLSSGLDTWTMDEAILNFDASVYGADKERAVSLLGVISPLQPNQAIIERVGKAVRSKYPGVRQAAVWAMAYSKWSEYREELTALIDREADEQLIRDAEAVASTLEMDGDST